MEKILSQIYSKLHDKDIYKIWRLSRCDLCSKPGSSSIYLPCSYSICRSHLPVDKFLASSDSIATSISFMCSFCQQMHNIPTKGFVKDTRYHDIMKLKTFNPIEYEKYMELSNFLLAADSELTHLSESVLYPTSEIEFLSDKYSTRLDKQKEIVPFKIEKLKEIMIKEALEWKKSCQKKIDDGKFNLMNLDEAFMRSLMYINLRSDKLNPIEFDEYLNSLLNLCHFEWHIYPKIEAEILNGLMYFRRFNIPNPYRFRHSNNENNFFDDRIKGIDYNSYVFDIQNLKEMIKDEGGLLKMVHFEFLNYIVILETSVIAQDDGKYLCFKLRFKDPGPGEEVDIAVEIRLLSNEPTEHFGKVENVKEKKPSFEIKFDKFMPIKDVLAPKFYKSKQDMIRIDLIIFKRRFMQRV